MSVFSIILTVLGLCVFEVVNSIDNAVINAEVLKGMSIRSRKVFLIWGMLTAIILVRGLLPWIIVWISLPTLGPIGSFTASLSSSPEIKIAVEMAKPGLLSIGGSFMVLLFLHWLLVESKEYGTSFERQIHTQASWFYTIASVLLLAVAGYAQAYHPALVFPLLTGSTIFFVTHGVKENAQYKESNLSESASARSDFNKIIYLEIIDAVFSVDGVLGAFAFTLAVPLILLGNGIGAIFVRQLTIGNLERITRYKYLKNGAMYSMALLGSLMLVQAFGLHVPEWVAPIISLSSISLALWRSL